MSSAMMYPSTIVPFTTMVVLLGGATCQLSPQIIFESQTNAANPKEYKRLTNSSTLPCIIDNIGFALLRSNSTFVSECKSAATLEADFSDDDITDIADLQSQITAIYRPLCTPECGNAIFNAYSYCGLSNIDDPAFSRAKRIIDGMCGTNQNGDVCYQIYGDAFQFAITEFSCDFQFRESGDCTCQSFLSEGISRLGCCINIHHFVINEFYDPSGLFDSCNVALPNDCNNSPFDDETGTSQTTPPFRGSGATPTPSVRDGADISCAPTITLMLSAIYFTVLNI